MSFPTVNQYAGCLVGQCLASALAQGVNEQPGEFCEAFAATILDKWWHGDNPPESNVSRTVEFARVEFARGEVARGEITNAIPRPNALIREQAIPAMLQFAEGAQLGLLIVDSFVRKGGFFPAEIARRIARQVSERRIIGRQWETYKSSKNMETGTPWPEAGLDLPGSSAAQRAGPVGLMFHHAPQLRLQIAAQQAVITNRNATAIAGAVVVAEAVAQLVNGGLFGKALIEHLAQAIAGIDSQFSRVLLRFKDWTDLAPREALPPILSTAPADPMSNAPDGIPSHVVPVVLWSLYSVMQSQGDFLRAMKLAVMPGGHVVATATITGACCGSRVGFDSLPKTLCARLVNGDILALAGLVELSQLLHQLMSRASEASPKTEG